MPLKPFVPALLLILAASAAAVVAAGMTGDRTTAAISAAVFAVSTIGVAWRINHAYWSNPGTAYAPRESIEAVRRNTLLAALAYAWGAVVLVGTELLSGLDWYHYWQYGLGAAIFATGLAWYETRLARPDAVPPAIGLTGLHGAAVVVALAYLVGSGKAGFVRADWVANVVFLWGGLAIVSVCAISAMAQARLSRH